jgi:hypothetical protein
MPTHLHLIVFDAAFDSERLLKSLADFRKFTGRQLSDLCERERPKCFADTLRQAATADRDRRLWQPSRHPEAIAEQWFWRQKVDYLHDNPCRKQLVRQPDHWRYSSAAWYATEGLVPADVPLTPIEWCGKGDLRSATVARSGDRATTELCFAFDLDNATAKWRYTRAPDPNEVREWGQTLGFQDQAG